QVTRTVLLPRLSAHLHPAGDRAGFMAGRHAGAVTQPPRRRTVSPAASARPPGLDRLRARALPLQPGAALLVRPGSLRGRSGRGGPAAGARAGAGYAAPERSDTTISRRLPGRGQTGRLVPA